MSNAWDDMKKAKEDSYFAKKNTEALQRLATKQQTSPRRSPITGEPMEQIVVHGVVIDRCPTSGGIWLEVGELEQLIEASIGDGDKLEEGKTVLNFIKGLVLR